MHSGGPIATEREDEPDTIISERAIGQPTARHLALHQTSQLPQILRQLDVEFTELFYAQG